ncbi:MAG: hypothetical protein HQK77_20795 [Desulfobacterales bacterium]|nr:hypothetical protein [Desulfobacterales bacterium]
MKQEPVDYKPFFKDGFTTTKLIRHQLYCRKVILKQPIHRHHQVFDTGEIGVMNHQMGYGVFNPHKEIPVTITFKDESGETYQTTLGFPWDQIEFVPLKETEQFVFEFHALFWQIRRPEGEDVHQENQDILIKRIKDIYNQLPDNYQHAFKDRLENLFKKRE